MSSVTETLVQRILVRESLQLGDQLLIATHFEIGVNTCLNGGDPLIR